MAVDGVGGEAAGRDRLELGSSYTKSSEKADKSHGYLNTANRVCSQNCKGTAKEFGEV